MRAKYTTARLENSPNLAPILCGLFYEIIVYSTPAKKVNQERKHCFYPMDIQSYTTINNDRHTIKQHKIRHRMSSLENWGGGLKSPLWLANSPHTPSALT